MCATLCKFRYIAFILENVLRYVNSKTTSKNQNFPSTLGFLLSVFNNALEFYKIFDLIRSSSEPRFVIFFRFRVNTIFFLITAGIGSIHEITLMLVGIRCVSLLDSALMLMLP